MSSVMEKMKLKKRKAKKMNSMKKYKLKCPT